MTDGRGELYNKLIINIVYVPVHPITIISEKYVILGLPDVSSKFYQSK
jgi:hypothetical protein